MGLLGTRLCRRCQRILPVHLWEPTTPADGSLQETLLAWRNEEILLERSEQGGDRRLHLTILVLRNNLTGRFPVFVAREVEPPGPPCEPRHHQTHQQLTDSYRTLLVSVSLSVLEKGKLYFNWNTPQFHGSLRPRPPDFSSLFCCMISPQQESRGHDITTMMTSHQQARPTSHRGRHPTVLSVTGRTLWSMNQWRRIRRLEALKQARISVTTVWNVGDTNNNVHSRSSCF